MYKIIRFYNQNRKQIIRAILIIAFIIGLIQLLNYFAKTQERVTSNNEYISNNIVSNELEEKLVSDKSAITGDTISATKLEEDGNVINDFMKYCNEKDIENAYNLLSNECKEEMYPTKEEFYDKYYINIFNNQELLFSIENWIDNTYKVEISENLLITGKITSNSKNIDYITIVEQDNEYKININSFIGRKKINKESETNNIKTIVVEKNIYMDYEIYKLKVQNNTGNKICLDTKELTDTIYLENDKEAKFYSASNEIDDDTLIINEKYTNEVIIKFNSSYSSSKKIKDIVFEKVVLDYKKYIQEDKDQYEDYYTLKIEL